MHLEFTLNKFWSCCKIEKELVSLVNRTKPSYANSHLRPFPTLSYILTKKSFFHIHFPLKKFVLLLNSLEIFNSCFIFRWRRERTSGAKYKGSKWALLGTACEKISLHFNLSSYLRSLSRHRLSPLLRLSSVPNKRHVHLHPTQSNLQKSSLFSANIYDTEFTNIYDLFSKLHFYSKSFGECCGEWSWLLDERHNIVRKIKFYIVIFTSY